jgi:hypothetical protein
MFWWLGLPAPVLWGVLMDYSPSFHSSGRL